MLLGLGEVGLSDLRCYGAAFCFFVCKLWLVSVAMGPCEADLGWLLPQTAEQCDVLHV